jgi:hypothetical protein
MDLNKIIQFKIELKDYPTHIDNPNYTFKTITTNNIDSFKNDILQIIDYHHMDLNWDGIPDYKTILHRLEFGSKMDLWVKSDKVVGWHWYNTQCVTLDWKSSYQLLNEGEIYGGSAFLSSKEKGFPSPAYQFYICGMKKNLIDEGKHSMYLYIDDWNSKSIKLVEKVGMKRFNFIK